MSPKDMYLVLYNLACMLGWGYALILALMHLASGGDLAGVWAAQGPWLQAAQWSMALEIVHAATGMVRSPALVTFMQVQSRLNLVFFVLLAPSVTSNWACGMMALSWCLVEVPRYAFYLNNLVGPGGQAGTLYPIFWLRYSLFAILYPTGITGEVLTMINCLSDPAFSSAMNGFAPLIVKFILLLYVPASPFMYMNMVGNRKSAFKKRFAPPPPPPKDPVGAEFPLDGKGPGSRSTSEAGKKVIAAAFAGAGNPEAERKCLEVKNWRFGYNKQIVKLARIGCESPKAALGSAVGGLKHMYETFVFHSADQKLTGPFGATVDKVKDSFHTGIVKGKKSAKGPIAYKVPYDGGWHPTKPKPPPADAVLSGDALKAQATKWAEGGIIEPDAAEALCWTADYFASGKTLEDVYVVMIGAGSAMGPFPKLLEMGATVVAIDIPGSWGKGGARPTSGLWKRLTETAENSPGSLIFPLSKPQGECKNSQEMWECSGCDLMKQPGEIANWLCEWQKTLKPSAKVMIGNYTYLDGDLHVKLALCADYCIQRLRKARPSTGVAFLCTPTDIHVCSDASDAAARKNYGSGFGSLGIEKLMNLISGGKFLIPNFSKPVDAAGGKKIKLVDGLSVAQGPNYALAKRMQHWRAQIEFEGGATVSSMVAPSTATISVIHNRTFAWAYGGMPYFCYEIFKQETTNAVMAAMLMHDTLNPATSKNPANRAKHGIDNSLELFRTQAVHGGLWRSPYKVDSLGECSALIYFGGLAAPYIAGLAALGGLAVFAQFGL